MRKLLPYGARAFLCLLLVGMSSWLYAGSPLSGAYTINAANPASSTNFTSFSMAADSLNTNGVSGAVTITVSAGVYNEYMSLSTIAGASGTNTITIDGGSATTTSIVHDGTTENHTIQLDGTQWLTITNLKIVNSKTADDAWGVRISNESDNTTISDCEIQMGVVTAFEDIAGILMNGSATSSSTEGAFGDNITISNVTINDGYYGMRLESLTAYADTTISISDCWFNGNIGYGMYVDNIVGLSLIGNKIEGASLTSKDGFYMFDLIDFNIQGNVIDVPDYGLYISDGNFDLTLPATRSKVINNMIASSTDEPLYFDDVNQCDVFHNTCATLDPSLTAAYGTYLNDLDDVVIKNNIFYSAGSYAFYSVDNLTTLTTVIVDYNDYFSGGANLAFSGSGNIFADLAAWQSGDGVNNINSVEGDPVFGIGSDLHVSGAVANDVGDNSVGITVDFEGDTRPMAPSTIVDMGADEFAAATCQQPSGIASYNETTTTSDVYWTTGGASNWQIQYGPTGFTIGTGTTVSSTNDTTTLVSLMSATTYDVYVKDSCSTTDVSGYSGPYSFTTLCAPFTAPVTESFDAGVLPNCWAQSAVSGGPWLFSGSPNTTCGSVTDNTGNGGSFAWMDQSSTDATVVLEMGEVDVSALTIPYIEFYYWMCGTGYSPTNYTILQTWDGAAWVHLDSISTATIGWEIRGFSLSGRTYGSNLVKVRFIAESGGSGSDFLGDNSIDDITIKEMPSCTVPSSLGATAVTATSASVYWTTGGATSWDVEYGVVGFTQGSGTMMNVSNDTTTLSSLTSSTDYEFYVRDFCGVGDVSGWVGPFSFTTLCLPFNTFPWLENFDASTSAPNCWENESGDDSDWIFRAGSIGHGATGDNTSGSGNYAGVDDSHSNINDTVNNLLTPSFDLTSLTNPRLNFYHYIGNDATLTSTLYIDVYDGTTWNMAVATIGFTAAAWQQEFVNLTAYKSTNSRIRFRVHETTDFNSDISIDDITVEETPACPAPTGLGTFGIAAASVSAGWLSSGTSFEVQYGATGFAAGSGTSMLTANDTVTITGLTDATTYDIYIREICGVGDSSAWVGPVTFTTLCFTQNLPYSENFDINLGCFSAIDGGTGTGDSWVATTNAGQNLDGTGYIRVDSDANGNGTHLIETAESPIIDASTVSNSLIIEFDHYFRAGDSASVLVYDGASWVTVAVYQNTTGGWSSPSHEIIDATAYANANFQVRFLYDDGNTWAWYWAIDNFSVEDKCVKQTLPYTENFDANMGCFTAIDGGTATGDSWVATINAGQNLDGTGYMRVDSDADGNGVHLIETMESPQIDATGLTGSLLLEFDHYFRSGDSASVLVYDGAGWVTVAVYQNTTGGWSSPVHEIIDVTAYANADFQVRFLYDDGNTWAWYWAVDNFSIAEVGCLQPSALGVYNVVQTSADVYWTSGGASNWNIEYGPAGFTPGTGTIVAATNDTTSLTGLMAATDYDVYVQDSCGLGDVSSWEGPASFTTLCAAFNTFPWVENFDAAASIPNCWENETGDNSDWIFRSGSIGHGSTSDNTTGSGNYAGVDDSQSNANDTVNNLLTPSFDLSSLTTPRLNFYHFIGNDATLTSTLYIDVYDGTTWNMAVATIGFTAAAWQQELLDLTAYSSTNTRIRFRAHETTDFNSDISIDDVTIEETPSCAAPSNLSVFNISDTAAAFAWTSGGASNWNFELGLAGFTPGTGFMLAATNDSIGLQGFAPGTQYEFYVQDSCGLGDVSAWVGPFLFTTTNSCPALETIPYFEFFNVSEGCFTAIDGGAATGDSWEYTVNAGQNLDGTGYMRVDSDADGNGVHLVEDLESPVFDASVITNGLLLEFDHYYRAIGGDSGTVQVFDGAAWVNVATFTASTGAFGAPTHEIIDVTAYANAAFQVRFHYNDGNTWAWYWAVDNFSLEDKCAVQPLPYTNNFDADASCFRVGDGGGATGDTWAHTINAGQNLDGTGYMRVDSDANGNGIELFEVLRSPDINATGITGTLMLEFDHYFRSIGAADTGWVNVWDGSAWNNVLLVTATTGAWSAPTHEMIDISAYANDNLSVEFIYSDGNSWAWYWSVDNFSVAEVGCLQPTALGVLNVQQTTADIYWTTGGASNWNIEYGLQGFTPGTGTIVAAINDTITLTGLMGSSNYEAYVQDSCGVGDVSTWLGPIAFTTQCAVVNTFPWIENFDAAASIPNCWENEVGDDADWIFRAGSIGHGATGDNTSGSGNYAGMDDSGIANDTVNNLLTPSFDLTSLVSPRLNFYHFIGNDNVLTSTLYIDVYDGTTWNMSVATIGFTAAAWQQEFLNLSAYSSANTRIRFRGHETTDFNSDISIDDVIIEETPSCAAPTGITSYGITANDAWVTWTSPGSSFEVQYGPAGFVLGTGTVMASSNDTINLPSLLAATDYDVYVREICGPADTSSWAGPGAFTTLCSTFIAPFMESFDGTSTPNCWAESAVSGGPWLYSTGNNSVNCPQATDHTGNAGNYAWMDQSGADASVSLETPVIDVTSLTVPYLEFYYWMCGVGYTPTNMTIIETWDGAAWLYLDTLDQATAGWEVQGYDLTGRTYGANLVRVRFTAESGGSGSDFFGDNSLDDVSIIEAPSCPIPTNLSAFNINDTSAALAWASGGTNWNVEIGLAGFTPGTGFVIAWANDSIGLQGFAPGTQYEFYVQDSCGLGDVSPWAGPFLFTTTQACPPLESLPFYESFDVSEGCFDTIDGGAATGDGWAHTVNATQNLDGTGYMRVDSDLNGNGVHMIEDMESPIIDASTVSNSLILEFDHFYRAIGTDSGNVQVFDGTAWVTIATYTASTGAFGAPTREVFDVTAYANAAFQVRFHYDDANVWAWYWAVDNFSVEDKCTTQSLPYTNNFDVDASCFDFADLGAATGDGWAHTINAAQNLDGTGYMRVDSDLNGNGVEMREIMTSPSIDASGITGTLMLDFDHYYRTIGSDTGWVNVWDGSAWNTVAMFTADIGAFGAPDHQAIDISAYANADLRVMFEYYDGNSWAWYWSVDNFSVAEVGCVAPSALGFISATQTTADVFWTSGGASNWNVEYGPTGFTPGTGTMMMATNDSVTLTGLMAATCYDFYVQDSCGLGDVSTWTGPFNICTACGPFMAPITESFDGTSTPLCWNEYAVAGGPWLYSTGLNSVNCPGAPDHTGNGGNYAWMDQSGTDTLVTLEMNAVDVTALTTPYLEFFYWMCGSGYTPINMTIIETWDGTNWVLLDTLTLPTVGWERQGYSLAGLTYGANLVKVRFTAESGRSGSDFFGDNGLDDISIIEEPACLNPTNFMVTGNSLNSVDLMWTSDVNILSSTIQYGAPGFTLGTGTNFSSTPGSTSVTGLASGTCYDFYVQDSCTSLTAWVGPIIGCTGSVCSVTTIPTTVGDSANCGGGPITLTGTAGSGDIAWMLNGTVLGTGNSYSDSIGGTTLYNAADYSVVAPAAHLGPLTSIAAAGFGNFSNGQYFTVMDTIFIDSTTVRANGFVEASVVIFDDAGGNLVQLGDTFTTGTTLGDYQVPVGILLTPGNYFMGIDFHATTTGQLFRATSGASYPYVLPGLMSIDSVNFAGARYYYTFDLVVSGACLGSPVQTIGFVPGANSGTSDTVDVCETNAAVNLASFLGPHDGGGTWVDVDLSGALTDSTFNATLADTNNYYNFNYILGASGGCSVGDTATITVLVNFQRSAGSDGADTICTNISALISLTQYLGAHTGGGSWADLDTSGALLGIRIRPTSVVGPGTYRYRYTVAASGACPGESSIVTITYTDPVDAGMDNSDTICDTIGTVDLTQYLDATATAGGTWVDLDGAGGLSGSTLTTGTPAGSASYTFAYALESAGCGNDTAFIEIYVDECNIGLIERISNQFNVYPNPTTGVFFIESLGSTAKDMKIEVYSVNGQLLLTNQFAGYNETNTVDLTDLAKGVYNVKVFTEYGVEVHRITKQ